MMNKEEFDAIVERYHAELKEELTADQLMKVDIVLTGANASGFKEAMDSAKKAVEELL